MQDIGAGRLRRSLVRVSPAALGQRIVILVRVGKIGDQSSPSYRLIGPPGMMVEIACL
jgi:hypothetical protein